ncbi:MAG: aminotransferase class I/II-fold pyridoxal phosphate-dependent enzyme [Pseudomonadota bacterium]|nr:aminotransferase class I/II-fold pyridoxal phosphate-dependent enzyme [Pseudomonadota bacterium]
MSDRPKIDRRVFLAHASLAAASVGMTPGSTSGQASHDYNFDEIVDRAGSDCIKWDGAISEYGAENIKVAMGIADMDFRVAPAITEALMKRLNHDVFGYGIRPTGYEETISDWLRRRHGEEIGPELILSTAGVHEGLISSLRAFAPRGSKVVLQTPIYSSFWLDIRKAGGVPREVPLQSIDGRFEMDFDALDRAFDDETSTLVLCNPNNPTGNCWSKEDLTTLGELCMRRGVFIISDEVHCDITRRGIRYTPFSTLDNKSFVMNSVTLKSTSKAFNLAGAKIGYAYSINETNLERILATGHYNWLNSLGFIACHAAYTDGEEWLDLALDYIDKNMNFVEEYVATQMPYVDFVKPDATFLAWLDFREFFERVDITGAVSEADEPKEAYFVHKTGVHLSDGAHYGFGGNGFMRMNVATSIHRVRQALDSLATEMRAA